MKNIYRITRLSARSNLFKIMIFTMIVGVFSGLQPSFAWSQESVSDSSLNRLLLFKFKEDVGSTKREAFAQTFFDIKSEVDGFLSVVWMGSDNIKADNQFDYGVNLKFSSETAREKYEKHPLHLKLMEEAPSMIAGFYEMNYLSH